MMNWLMQLTALAKEDQTALELLRALKAATTEEEKEKAKENGKAYIEKVKTIQTNAEETPAAEETETTDPVAEDTTPPAQDLEENQAGDSADSDSDSGEDKAIEAKFNMAEPAFNPRLAKMGITREEELFIKGIMVRKISKEEKLLIRRSIYQKKKKYTGDLQAKYKEKRETERAARLADPAYQEFQIQRKYILKISEALKAHNNIGWMLKNIDGLTVDVLRKLLEDPANVNEFRQYNENFVDNFKKKYGV
jgi:hypothetical protein